MTQRARLVRFWERLAWQGPRNAAEVLLLGLLKPFATLYGNSAEARNAPGKKARRLPCPVLSVGNITVGGSGKTPFAIYLAGLCARRHGRKVAAVSRGYGKDSPDEVTVVSDGETILVPPREAGDEAYLLAQKVPGTVVVTSADRYRGGLFAVEEYGAELIVLDDGFQQRRNLQRQLDIVMVDAERGLGTGYCLPAGPLREPFQTLAQADWLAVYHRPGAPESRGANLLPPAVQPRKVLHIHASAGPVQRLGSLVGPSGRGQPRLEPLEAARSRSIAWLLVSGIAHPESFERTAGAGGLQPAGHLRFMDHHAYRPEDWPAILRQARHRQCQGILTTEKDFWKLLHIADEETLKGLGEEFPLATVPLELKLGAGEQAFLADLERICTPSPG